MSAPPSSSSGLLGDLSGLLLIFALMTSLTVIGGAMGRASARRARRRAAARGRTVTPASSAPYVASAAPASTTTPHAAAAATPYVATTPTATPAGRSRRRTASIVAGTIAGALLLTLIVGGIVRWNRPASTVRQAFESNFFAGSAQAAYQARYALLCPDAQARYSESAVLTNWSANEGAISDVDFSRLTFTTEDGSWSVAHVRVARTYTYTHQGQSGYFTFDSGPSNLHTVLASGLGWCLTTDIVSPNELTR